MNIHKSVVWLLGVATVVSGALFAERYPAPQSAFAISTFKVAGEPTDREAETYQAGFSVRSVADALADNNVQLAPEDKAYAFPDPSLGIGTQVKVYRAQIVSLKDGDVTTEYRTWAPTVRALLDERGIQLGDKDIVSPVADAVIPITNSAFKIAITRVAITSLEVKSSIPFKTTYVDDSSADYGTQTVRTAGKVGTRVMTYTVRRDNGVEVSRTLVSNIVSTAQVDAVIARGTRRKELGRGITSWYGGVPAYTAASLTIPMGTSVLVTNLANGKSVVVKIADHGPYIAGRILDMDSVSFSQIASLGAGVANVKIELQ
jgi:G5 domain/Lytic transglycolase/G5-linked-Ubiquitin-like domain